MPSFSEQHQIWLATRIDLLLSMSALHRLAATGDAEQLMNFIKNQKVDVNYSTKYNENFTPLHVAAMKNNGQSHYNVAEILLNAGADANARDYKDRTPLWYLVENPASVEILKLFSKFKADFTCVEEFKSSLLHSAVQNGDSQLGVLKFLVQDVGLDVNAQANNRSTPLHHAIGGCKKGVSHTEVFKFLLENGTDPNVKTWFGITPLHCLFDHHGSYANRHEQVYCTTGLSDWRYVQLFVSYGAKVDSNIFWAFQNCTNVQTLDKLINFFGLDVNFMDEEGCTGLHELMRYHLTRTVSVVKCLLRNGANMNIPDKDGLTPLVMAVRDFRECSDLEISDYWHYFKFLIGQLDFSVVHNDVHIFYYYHYRDDTDSFYYDHYAHSNLLWKWILKHLAELNSLNSPIHPVIRKFIEDHADYSDYFEKCTEELKAMKMSKLKNSWLTFFNLLVDSRRKLKNYSGNEDLIEDSKKRIQLNEFPIYGDFLKKNVDKCIRRRKLFDESAVLLSNFLPIFNPTHLIITDILDCVLSKKVLSKFCE